jgi:hypothetical protein
VAAEAADRAVRAAAEVLEQVAAAALAADRVVEAAADLAEPVAAEEAVAAAVEEAEAFQLFAVAPGTPRNHSRA